MDGKQYATWHPTIKSVSKNQPSFKPKKCLERSEPHNMHSMPQIVSSDREKEERLDASLLEAPLYDMAGDKMDMTSTLRGEEAQHKG